MVSGLLRRFRWRNEFALFTILFTYEFKFSWFWMCTSRYFADLTASRTWPSCMVYEYFTGYFSFVMFETLFYRTLYAIDFPTFGEIIDLVQVVAAFLCHLGDSWVNRREVWGTSNLHLSLGYFYLISFRLRKNQMIFSFDFRQQTFVHAITYS